MAVEEWRPVVGFEGSYEVSDQGRVRSLARLVRGRHWSGTEFMRRVPPCVLRPGGRKKGAQQFTVAIGKGNSRYVHSLVLEAFVGPAPEGHECLHGDGGASNNCLSNLRWGTRSENNVDVFYTSGRLLSREQVLYIRKRQAAGFYYGERSQLARAWGVNPGTVYHVVSGKDYAHVR